MSALRVGGVVLDRGEALAHARRYLTDGVGWAYPSYDAYERQRAVGPLSDADLLAPVLLNVSRLRIKTYETLQAKRDELDEFLACIPLDLELASAGPDDLAMLGDMFAVLDGPGVWGARGTALAKILHRKRPNFVPLYDEQVRRTYQEGTDPGDLLKDVQARWVQADAVLARADVISWASPSDRQTVREEIQAEFTLRHARGASSGSGSGSGSVTPDPAWPGHDLDLRTLGMSAALPLQQIDAVQHGQCLALVEAALIHELGESEDEAPALVDQLRIVVMDFDRRRWLCFATRRWRSAVAPFEQGAEPDMNIRHMARTAAHFLTGRGEEPVPLGL